MGEHVNTYNVMSSIAMMGPQPGQQGQSGGGSMLGLLLPMIIIFGIFYIMLIRPQQRKEKERQKMIDEVKSGERVMFCGGMIGTVTNIKDGIFLIKVAENVKVEVARGAVNRVLAKDEKPEAGESK
jgi:preprotein translocase subunit YajC